MYLAFHSFYLRFANQFFFWFRLNEFCTILLDFYKRILFSTIIQSTQYRKTRFSTEILFHAQVTRTDVLELYEMTGYAIYLMSSTDVHKECERMATVIYK